MTWNVAFPPAGHGQSLGLNGMAQLLGGADRIEINQKVNRLEAASCGCYEQKNRFEVKIGDKDGPVVMTGQEESEFCDRCCCKPHHSLLVHLSPAYDESRARRASAAAPSSAARTTDYTTVGAAASGTITHLRPAAAATCKAACTDSDNYGVEFGPSATPADKANMIAASIVVDYMFFEIDQGMCHYDAGNQQIVITCFLCFCYGCLIPCNCYIPTKADGAPPRSRRRRAGAEGAILDAQPVAAEPPMRA
ncbi:hypothetical protein JL720_5515 [Aureococcus anophagefferens]|nr:hypothetical protein JL720_5515 [Aureococcus anophagefferens]